jgi:ATP-dependent Clp protease ATP-binding subunit ClpC
MRRKSFLRWYIGEGMSEMFAIWRRFVVFVPRLFSVGLLLRTLFAPWHRDVSLKSWRGINPLKSAQRFVWNIFSRLIGALVRLCVVVFGVAVWVSVILLGGGVVVLYLCAPAVVIVSVVLGFTVLYPIAIASLVVTVVIVLFAYRIYRISGHMPYRQMDMLRLSQQPWFYRAWERIGVESERVPKTALENIDAFEAFLTAQDVTTEEFEKIVAWETEKQIEREENKRFFSARKFLRMRPIGLNWHFGFTVHLDRYAEDLTRHDTSQYAQASFHGFDEELDLLNIVLARPNENNAMITGPAGTGRHMIVHETARRIRTGHYDGTFMKHMRVMQCDFTSVIAQAKSVGADPEHIIHNLFHEAAYAGNILFVVDNFERYMDTVANRGFSFTSIIDEYAALPTFRMIGVATDENFHEHIEHNRVLMRHFDTISLEEMDEEEAMKVLFMRFYGKEHTPFTFQALRQVLTDSARYTNTGPLPSRAIDLATEVLVSWQGRSEKFITADTIDNFVREKTGVPVGAIDKNESDKLLSLEDSFHERIVGQEYAVRTVAAAVRRMRSGMARPNKPAGSFLFLGPTGVGKTEMAKTVAEQYFGSTEKMIRLDMSEFQGASALDRLIGSKELKQQGILTTAVREHPYALLLLDEIEKANPRILDVFLQVLDEGFLHDAFGRKVNFTTMIIVATSNAAAVHIKKMIENGIKDDQMKKKVVDTIINSGAFRPELLNRFDDVVIFHPLGDDHILHVAKMLLARFSQRMEEEQYITVQFDDAVAQQIITRGFDPVFGARSLIRYIDDTVADALAKKLIAGNVHRGETIHFSTADMDV